MLRSWRWMVLVCLLSLGLVAAGCGDDDEDSGGGSGTSTQAKAPAKCNGETVRYQISFVPNAQNVGFLTALEQGDFKKQGLNLKMIPGGPTVNPALQLAQGNVDVAELPLSDAMNAVANGAKMKLFAQTAQQNPVRYMALKEVKLDDPKDLEGKTVGQQQTGNLAPELNGMLNSVGLGPDAVKVKSIGFDTADLVNKRVQVFPGRVYAHISMLEAQGFDYPEDINVLDPNKYGAGIADEGLYINDAYLAKNPNVPLCIIRATREGFRKAIADPKLGEAAVKKYTPRDVFSDNDIKVGVEETIKYATLTPEGEKVEPMTIVMPYIRDSAEKLRKYGVVKRDVNIDDMVLLDPIKQADASAGSGGTETQ